MPTVFRLAVEAGPHDRSFCPVSVELPVDYSKNRGLLLKDAKSGKTIPSQVSPHGQGITLSWLVTGLKSGETRHLTAKPVPNASHKPTVTVEDNPGDSVVNVSIFGKPFTAYHYGERWARPFLYPVIGPGGARVTRSWPVSSQVKGEKRDHPHHKSIWVAYGACGPAKVDNWSELPGHGRQRHIRFLKKESGAVFGEIVAKNDWCTNRGRKQFEETRAMRFYALPGGTRLFDLAVTFRMTEGPITFYDTKEGGLVSVRVASSMDVPRTGRIENAYGGINEAETWGKNAPWCDYSGVVDGVHAGIAIMDHETNPRYPTGWHVRDYGLMTANCFAWKHYRPHARMKGDMTFGNGSRTMWRYRLLIHPGDAARGKVKDRFMDFIASPRVALA
ncbi:MAG TPA: PmoA family protein [Candidatus Hydrogenedentes bacterium]|nr:PmoA family protein [Candidatus Hydrogenedentota bacterium]